MNSEAVKSVKKRLKEYARNNTQVDLNHHRVTIALERCIARIQTESTLREHLIFKGGFVLFKAYENSRFTRDIDSIANGLNKKILIKHIRKAMTIDLNDGLWFGGVKVTETMEDDIYGGLRFSVAFEIGDPDINKIHKLSRVIIDVGLSDKILHPAIEMNLKSTVHDENISWKIYPIEQIIAEKIHAMIELGDRNSRSKDIFDLNLQLPKANLISLKEYLVHTFAVRKTDIPQNFFEAIENINTDNLKKNWKNIENVSSQTLFFDKAWETVGLFLKKLT